MLETLQTMFTRQFEAALATMALCIERCPEELWEAKVANLSFDQVAFHTLFFADYYLGRSKHDLTVQPFHLERTEMFRDYEELLPRRQVLHYRRDDLLDYATHCRHKAIEIIGSDTLESLAGPNGVVERPMTRAEFYVYNIRHIQHHAAQLSLRLRLDAGVEIGWVRSGWPEPKDEG
jgi:hypothetical protein